MPFTYKNQIKNNIPNFSIGFLPISLLNKRQTPPGSAACLMYLQYLIPSQKDHTQRAVTEETGRDSNQRYMHTLVEDMLAISTTHACLIRTYVDQICSIADDSFTTVRHPNTHIGAR